jgi:hypothetical protein
VAHKEFLSLDLSAFKHDQTLVYDIKAFLPYNEVDVRL